MTPIKKSLEMIAKDRQTFCTIAVASVTLFRLTQIAFSQQQTLTLTVTNRPFSSRNYARASFWSSTVQQGSAIFNRFMSTCLGIYRSVSQVPQNHFLGSDQDYNGHLCKGLIAEIKKPQYWLASFSNDLGEDLKFFYEKDTSAISFQDKQKTLIFVLRLNDLRRDKGYLRNLSHAEFSVIVQIVIGDSLRIISETQFKTIDKVWSFFSFSAQEGKLDIIQDTIRRFPALLKIFIQMVATPAFHQDLHKMETLGTLGKVINLLKSNPELYFALLNGDVGFIQTGPAPTSFEEVQDKLTKFADEFGPNWKKSKIQKAMGVNPSPTVSSSDPCTRQVDLIYNHYQSNWMIYPIDCYLEAIMKLHKNFSNIRVILNQFVTYLETATKADSDIFNEKVSNACFESYIFTLLKDETNDAKIMGNELIEKLFPEFKKLLKEPAQDQETALLILNNMGLFFRECCEYKKQGYPSELMVQNARLFIRNNLSFYQTESFYKFLDFLDFQLRGLNSDQYRWKAIIKPILNHPFNAISTVAVPFIRQLIPQDKQACVDQFEAGLPHLKPFLVNTETFFDLSNVLKDPMVVKLVERAEFGNLFWLSWGDLKTQWSQFLKKRSEGAGAIGDGGLMELPLIHLMVSIKSAQELRREMVQNRVLPQGREARIYLKGKNSEAKLQEWLVVELPEVASQLDIASTILYLMTTFMKLSLGSLPLGTSLVTDFLGTVSGLFKLSFVSTFIANQARKNDPDAAFADLLEGFTDEQKHNLVPILQHCVIPMVSELLPVLQKNHDLTFYKKFFVYLDGVVKSKEEINQPELQKQVASAFLHMISEMEKYKPALHKTLQHVYENADLSVLQGEAPKSSSGNEGPQVREDLD